MAQPVGDGRTAAAHWDHDWVKVPSPAHACSHLHLLWDLDDTRALAEAAGWQHPCCSSPPDIRHGLLGSQPVPVLSGDKWEWDEPDDAVEFLLVPRWGRCGGNRQCRRSPSPSSSATVCILHLMSERNRRLFVIPIASLLNDSWLLPHQEVLTFGPRYMQVSL